MPRRRILSVTLDDCDLQTFSAGGPGGQHQNTSNTAVRIVHRASGAVGVSRDERSQLQNKKLAWRRMAESPVFRAWVQAQTQVDPQQRVTEQMTAENLFIMTKQDGAWRREEST